MLIIILIRPRVAFHADGKIAKIDNCLGMISKEMVMIYPPGIPLIIPGEVWTKELIDRVKFYKTSGITILSNYPDGFEVVDNEKWKKFPIYQKRLNDYRENRRTTPSGDGFKLPFEGEKHKATVILLPYRKDTWRDDAVPALANYKQVIEAISKHEKVIVGVHPLIYERVAPSYKGMKNVELLKIRYNDSWARDNMGIYLTNGKTIRGVDFRFNAWGGEVDGLYSNYQDDDKLTSTFDKKYKISDYRLNSFVFEGGSIAFDGKGTAIVTEACLLSKGRNPTLRKEEIEEVLKEYLSLEKVIWVPHGIYMDETNEHVDNMVAFVKPGVVVMAWTDNQDDPQYEYCKETYEALANATDARGKHLEIHKAMLPNPPLYMSEEESKGIEKSKFEAKPRMGDDRLSASYVNYYQGKNFIILPAFGVKEDEEALELFKKLYPKKKIHQINTREILLGGGNIHCITMQIPEVNK